MRLAAVGRRLFSWPAAVIAAISYIPLLLTAPGYVGADTKQYLYLDPDRLLARAPYLWDKYVGMGGVTHQNIGYLLPQGPWYWVFQHLGVPDWIAQRLWTGTLLFAAGMGVLALMRTLGWKNRPAFMASASYMLSPYILEYVARISAILLPWAGLPWMVVFVVRGLRFQALHVTQESLAEVSPVAADLRVEPDELADSDWESKEREDGHFANLLHGFARWRYPALFALTVALIGGTNATSLIYAGLAPVIWLPFAIARREVTFRDALAFVVRALVLTIGVSAWWATGLLSQAGYGLDVLAYSETVKTVASDSQASEVLRGLGNWFFYGRDGISAWIQPSLSYTESLWLIAVSFLLPVLSLISAACLRWVHRGYFVVLVLVGTALSVGVYPYDNPSPAGSAFKAFAEGSTAGLALRSTPRAVPLVALGFGVILAAGIDALFRLPWRRAVKNVADAAATAAKPRRFGGWKRWAPAGAFLAVLVLIGLDMLPLWRGQFVDPNLRRKETLPSYVTAAAKSLSDSPRINGSETRILELPGADFSDYRWGATLDPPLPGLTDRSYVSRELIPSGEPASAALVRAIDRRLQEGVYEPSALPALARLMSVGDVVLRSDLQYERFRTPQPISTWETWTRLKPAGLTNPKTFGPAVSETPAIPFIDEISLAEAPGAAKPPAMADFGVTDPVPIVRAERATEPLLVAGDSEGLVDASAAGMLDSTGVVRFAASQTSEKTKATPVPSNADLLLTDSNRKRAERWGTVRENYGYVETATGKPLEKDPNDARLPVFPGETTDDQTVAVLSGVKDIEASDYGNDVSYSPSDRPFYAFDGDQGTAWRVGAFGDPHGARLKVTLNNPVTTNHLTLVQPYNAPVSRWITKAQLTFDGPDGTSTMDVNLGDSSRSHTGQVVSFPSKRFTSVEFKIVQTSNGTLPSYDGQSGVGLAELNIPGITASEVLRLPTDLFTAAGTDGSKQALSVMLTRDRANPQEPFKSDTELSMARQFTLPTARTFGIGGTARLSATATDPSLDSILGRDDADASTAPGIVTATSSNALPGSLDARASSAFDDNPKTAWTNAFGGNIGSWIQMTSATPVTLSSLNLKVIADGKHSVPTSLQLLVDGKAVRNITLPAITDGKSTDNTVSVPVSFAAVTGSTFRFVVRTERKENTEDYFNHGPLELPVAIAELGAPGLTAAKPAASLPTQCRRDLMTIDGKPIGVEVGGSSTAAIARDGLEVRLCGNPVKLSAGTHTLLTARGSVTGIDLDRLVLSSAADQSAGDPADAFPGTVRTIDTPRVTVTGEGPVAYRLSVSGATTGKPFWLVLGQSLSPGWQAKVVGASTLGEPQLIDAYANGWLINPTSSTMDIELDWTPQNKVWIGIGVSAVSLLICLLMVLRRGPVRLGRSAELDELPGSEAMPYLVSPWRRDLTPLSKRRAGIAALVAAAVSALLITPLSGLIILAATLIALFVPRGRLLLRVGSVAALAVSAGYVMQVQARYNLPETGQWVQAFHKVATLSWLAVAFLVADVLVGWARREDKLDLVVVEKD